MADQNSTIEAPEAVTAEAPADAAPATPAPAADAAPAAEPETAAPAAEPETAAPAAKPAKAVRAAKPKARVAKAPRAAKPARAKAAAPAPAVKAETPAPVAKPAARRKAAKPARQVRAAKAPVRAAKAPARAAKAQVRAARALPKAAAKPVSAPKVITIKSIFSNEGTKTMFNETNNVAERFQAVFGDVNERAKTTIERNTRIAEELTDLGRGNVEAVVASTKVAAKGFETLGQEVAEFGRKSFEDASAALKSLAEVKSPADFFRLQGDFARTQFDALVAESSKLSETVIKIAGEVAEPITNRATVAAERVRTAVAA
jgi:phasin family protein